MLLHEYLDTEALDVEIRDGYVTLREHPEDASLWILNYSKKTQIERHWNDVTQKCRGLIVKSAWWTNVGPLEVIARPFEKFYNLSEHPEDTFNLDAPVWATDKADGCFPRDARLNLWGGGTIAIGDVVKEGLSPTLVGMDAAGNIVPTHITGRFDNGLKGDWMRVGLSTPASRKSGSGGHPNRLYVTPNHHIYRAGEYVPAADLRPGDVLTAHRPTFDGLELFLGGLLGDGSVCRNGSSYNYQECHTESARGYVEGLRAAVVGDGLVAANDTRGGYADTVKVWLQTRTAEVFERLREEWYPRGRKSLPADLSFMTDAVVAKWFMDDGSLAHSEGQNDRATIAANGFSEAEVRRLAEKLVELYGASVTPCESRGYWGIRINWGGGSIGSFWSAIAPYVFPAMQYKLPEEFRGRFTGFPLASYIDVATNSMVTSVEFGVSWAGNNYGKARTRAYDIETTTHNYMCNGVLVHNSLGILYPAPGGGYAIATRGSFTSDQAIEGTKILQEAIAEGFTPHEGVTYLFEVIYPGNRIVLDYGTERKLVLLDALVTDSVDREPATRAFLEACDFFEPAMGHRSTLRQLVTAPQRPNAEGWVAYTACGRMVKVKQEDYVQKHRIVFGLSEISVWEAMRDGTILQLANEVPEELREWVVKVWMRLYNAAEKLRAAATDPAIRARAIDFSSRGDLAAWVRATSDEPDLTFAVLDGKDIDPSIFRRIRPKGASKPQFTDNEEERAA